MMIAWHILSTAKTQSFSKELRKKNYPLGSRQGMTAITGVVLSAKTRRKRKPQGKRTQSFSKGSRQGMTAMRYKEGGVFETEAACRSEKKVQR